MFLPCYGLQVCVYFCVSVCLCVGVRVGVRVGSVSVSVSVSLSVPVCTLKSSLLSLPDPLQIYCVFLFLAAVSLFGTLISQLNEIVAAQTNQTKDLENTLASYLTINPR